MVAFDFAFGSLSLLKRLLSELEVEVDFREDVSERNDLSDVEGMVLRALSVLQFHYSARDY